MSNGKSSRWWPYIKGLARLVGGAGDAALPGAGFGMRFLTELQDDLDKRGTETKEGITEALNDIRVNTALIVKLLAAEQLIVTREQLHTAANQQETLAAREKQKLIKDRFRTWVFSDPDRTERLVRIYNDTYNNLRNREKIIS